VDASKPTLVTQVPPAPPEVAARHFEGLLAVETDCWDVHESMADGGADFVLLHVFGDQAGFDAAHVPGAVFLHHSTMTEERLAQYPADTLFVVYCAGPHCNAADKAGVRLARLGRPVKKMIGGQIGWLDEGYELVSS
jgi:rhodanese-related sulfurtransferase